MVSDHYLYLCIALFDSVLDKGGASLMLLVEIRKVESLALVDNMVKIGDTTLSVVGILQVYFRPQGAYYDVNVVNTHDLIIIGMDIRTDFKIVTIFKCAEVESFVELMIARHDNHLLIVFRRPVPERMLGIILIAKVTDVTGEHEDIASHFQRILLQEMVVFAKLQMEIRSVLDFHSDLCGNKGFYNDIEERFDIVGSSLNGRFKRLIGKGCP